MRVKVRRFTRDSAARSHPLQIEINPPPGGCGGPPSHPTRSRVRHVESTDSRAAHPVTRGRAAPEDVRISTIFMQRKHAHTGLPMQPRQDRRPRSARVRPGGPAESPAGSAAQVCPHGPCAPWWARRIPGRIGGPGLPAWPVCALVGPQNPRQDRRPRCGPCSPGSPRQDCPRCI